jgi:hypothetical protein
MKTYGRKNLPYVVTIGLVGASLLVSDEGRHLPPQAVGHVVAGLAVSTSSTSSSAAVPVMPDMVIERTYPLPGPYQPGMIFPYSI